MPHCPRCASEVPADARFCIQCGAPVAGEPEPLEPRPEDVAPSEPASGEHEPVDPAPDPAPGEPVGASSPDLAQSGELTDQSMPTADATRSIEVDLRACPRCGASNAAGRARCGRCGGYLDRPRYEPERPGDTPPTGREAPAPPAAPAGTPRRGADGTGTGSRGPQPRRPRRRGVAAAFVGGGLLVGAALGVAVGTGLGPFSAPVEVQFEPASYPAEPEPVRPANTGATSTHPSVDDHAFGPTLALDGDRTTAWAPQPDDAEARLVHRFAEPVWIDHVEVATGLPDEVAVDGLGRVTAARIDLRTRHLDATIADEAGMQVIRLQEPVLVEEVIWRITRSSPGTTGALAEVRYRGWPADQADREVLRGR